MQTFGSGDAVGDLVRRPEGVRIKHRVERNSIKMYDKQRSVLFPSGDSDAPAQRRRQSGQITRKLALLQVHGLIKKVPKSRRYLLNATGQTAIATLLTVRDATAKQLNRAA